MVTRAKWTTRERMAALGAAFDCEGCVSIGRPYKNSPWHNLRVRMAMTDEAGFYPRWFEEVFSGSGREYRPGLKPTYRNVRTWTAAGATAGRFLDAILPWVEVKRPQVLLAIEFQGLKKYKGRDVPEENLARRWDIYWEMRRLNTGPHVQRLSEEALAKVIPANKRAALSKMKR